MLLFSLNFAFAENNDTTMDVVGTDSVSEIPEISHDDVLSYVEPESVLEASNVINVHVSDSYDEKTKTWDEDGVSVSGATVKLYDSSNKLVSTHTTDKKGNVVIKNIASSKYYVEISHSTYEPFKSNLIDFTKNSGTLDIDYVFVPDILLLVSYNDHNEKVDVLMNLSRRVAYISTTDFDKSRSWLTTKAKYIHIDMFAESGYTVFTSQYLKELLSKSPANAKYNVAYTFGVYSKDILDTIGIHIVGANSTNNTFHTIENTYIGSYFQAQDINNSDILYTNMKNYLNYVYYLINPSKYSDPTLDVNNAPLMSPECGFYHPDLGIYSMTPDNELINKWIHENPGYTSQDGSLKWMIDNYSEWLIENLDPTSLFSRFEKDYINKFGPDKKFIAIASYYCGGDVVDALIRSYEANGRPAFNIFKFSTQPAMSSLLNSVNNASVVGISSVTSLYSWSLSYANGSAEGDLSDIDLTILKGVNEISEYSYNSELGPQIEWTYSVTYPSFEGVFGPIILSYLDENGDVHVVQSGVEKMVKLSCGWADLKDLDNYNKTIAIVLYNYPPGKAEIGASYLDVFNSTYQLLIKMYQNGYDIGCDIKDLMSLDNLTQIIFDMNNKGSWASGLLNKYVEDNWDYLMEHHQLISVNEFYDLIEDANGDLIKQMFDYWGNNLGPAMVYNKTAEHYIVIPGVWFGKIFITFQPSRGWEETTNYHDLTLPPHQQYVAFYEWLDKTANVNAVINMGTHGTLEWLPGTNLGAVEGDWTFELQKLPTIYPYIVSNPGEAMVARDRIASLMITHMTPAMVSSELYGNYTLLANYINHYKDQVKLNVTSNAEEYMAKILKLAPELGFRNMSDNETFTEYVDKLHLYLEDMEDDFNTYGLHVIGNILTGDNLTAEVITIVTSQTKIYNQIFQLLYWNKEVDTAQAISQSQTIIMKYIKAAANGESLANLNKRYGFPENATLKEVMSMLKNNAGTNSSLSNDLNGKNYYDDIQGNLAYLVESQAVRDFLYEYISRLVNGSSVEELNGEYGIEVNSSLYESTQYAAKVILNIQNNNEWEAIFTALGGGYLKSGLFADPSYGDSIPTGYDGYASDSTKMPTEAAYESAVKIVDLLLANYYEEHGSWPELTALILWGTEISRTEGIGVAEFLYFLGCKPQWTSSGKVNGTELIPLEDLKVKLNNGTVVNRPRVDVYASMVTSNKDWITWMLTAINLAAFAEGENETNNFVKKHYNEYPSLDRLFGLPGNILEGTGMSTLIPNTADWNISTINQYAADIYLNKVSYSWTLDEKGNVVVHQEREAYEHLLSKTDLITQNFDSTWRFFDSDDYYDWFGGLYNAASLIKEKQGKKRPSTAFVDIRNKNNYISRTYEEEINFEIRSIITNPQYYRALISTPAGMNAWASKTQNMYAGVVLGGGKLNSQLGNQMADTALTVNSGVDKGTLAPGIQSTMAWLIYMANQGLWDGDPQKVQKLVDEYMNSVIEYGVACCHHTCKNLEFNKEIIQMSSLTPAQKQKFAEILAQATNTEPLYQMDRDSEGSSNENGNADGSANSDGNGNQNANTLVNGTEQNQESDGSDTGGRTSAGEDPASGESNAKYASQNPDASTDSSSSGETGDSGTKSYEVTEKSSAKSLSATESSMPIFVIIAVIALIAIFLVGYVRDNDDDFDDY